MSTLAIVGFGYVGQALADAFSGTGLSVVAIDPLKARSMPGVFSSVGEAMVSRTHHASISFVIAVPTPLDENGSPDLSFVREAAKSIAPHLKTGDGVALESTTYPGTTAGVVKEILESGGLRAGLDFALCFSSERIDPGREMPPLEEIPKVVGAFSDSCFGYWKNVYSLAFNHIHRTKGMGEAELSKLIENSYRLVNISLVNEIARYAKHAGLDIHDAIEAASTKPYGFQAFYPSIGAGGHCIPVDPGYLVHAAEEAGSPTVLLTAAMELNRSLFSSVFQEAMKKYCSKYGRLPNKVLIFGASYKAGSKDFRESPVLNSLASIRDDFPDTEIEVVDSGAPITNAPGGIRTTTSSSTYDLALVTVVHQDDLMALGELDIAMALDVTINQTVKRSLPGWQSGFHL